MEEYSCARAGIVSLLLPGSNEREVSASFDELERLLETAGGKAVFRMVQSKDTPDPGTYIGSGKVKELSDLCEANDVSLVVFDVELTPSQIRNVEDGMEGDVRVIDRSMLILDIFALHATTNEGKLQVELAQLKYTVPRLIGKGTQLSRQGGSGSIAARGPGETKLETDRRHVKRRIQALEEELNAIADRRATQRKQRDRSGISKVAIAGYTNAGKSTLLNRLTGAGILAEDKLFATLDPTTRKYTLPDGREVLFVDTVGFIRNLPTHLIRAFRSTLDEVTYADVILVVIDASDPEHGSQRKVTEALLSDLGCAEKPTLYLFNKCDREADVLPDLPETVSRENILCLSAATGEGVDAFVSRLTELLNEGTSTEIFSIPMAEAGVLNQIYANASVLSTEYLENAIEVTAVCDAKARGMFRKWKK